MVRSDISEFLTKAPVDRMRARTHDGQAHWGGTGPDGKTCRECASWEGGEYRATTTMGGGALKPARCAVFRHLTGQEGKAFPHTARACKHFQQAGNPPSVTRRDF